MWLSHDTPYMLSSLNCGDDVATVDGWGRVGWGRVRGGGVFAMDVVLHVCVFLAVAPFPPSSRWGVGVGGCAGLCV